MGEMEDSDSADEKVEHYLESPEKEPQKSPEKEQPQKEEDKTCEIAASQLEQEENQESHAVTCNLHLQNNKEIDNNIMEEKLIEVKSPTHSFASSSSGSYSVNNTENGKKISPPKETINGKPLPPPIGTKPVTPPKPQTPPKPSKPQLGVATTEPLKPSEE